MEVEALAGKEEEHDAAEADNEAAQSADEPPGGLKGAEGGLPVACGLGHGHLVARDRAEADVGEGEGGGDGGEDEPLAIKRDGPEVQKDRHLDQLGDGSGELGDPVGKEAEQKAALG